ncbi:MAG: hypothetical protein K0U68_14595, partial [Gammaproteobacteria bacterium]|nr:hypothetical protein [Gammaproteobacteria bacterium]
MDAQGCRFVADVHCDQHIYLDDPKPVIPKTTGRGRRPKHLQAQSESLRVDSWAAGQPEEHWQRLTLRDGEKGALTADYLQTTVWVWDGREDHAHCWHLLVRREIGASTPSHYCLS